MRATMLPQLSLTLLALLAACDSPPKPPTVDESTRRPANSSAAVEFQMCRGDLQNSRLMAAEAGRLAQRAAVTLASLAARQQVVENMQSKRPPSGNRVYTVHFDFGSSRVVLPAETSRALIDEARAAPLVLLRGRTDGVWDTVAESRMARDRAVAVRDVLVAAGIEPSRIRATYQPSGDHLVDNGSQSGRALNRRVEIEIYGVAPVAIAGNPPGD